MEDQDPPINAHLRKQALEKSLQLYSRFSTAYAPDADVIVSDVMYVANKFYDFLKGETK